jgi:hypothetical protein
MKTYYLHNETKGRSFSLEELISKKQERLRFGAGWTIGKRQRIRRAKKYLTTVPLQ